MYFMSILPRRRNSIRTDRTNAVVILSMEDVPGQGFPQFLFVYMQKRLVPYNDFIDRSIK